MYGLVNKAIQGLVVERFGQARWSSICAEAGVDDVGFISLETYSDDVSYSLVGAASSQLDIPVEVLLEEFGKYWVLFTASEGYGDAMSAFGNTLPEFLANLDALHTRMALIMPDLQPPSFACEETGDTSLRLHYRSQRAGLVPMVVGLVKGLGLHFESPCIVRIVSLNEEAGTQAEFEVDWSS